MQEILMSSLNIECGFLFWECPWNGYGFLRSLKENWICKSLWVTRKRCLLSFSLNLDLSLVMQRSDGEVERTVRGGFALQTMLFCHLLTETQTCLKRPEGETTFRYRLPHTPLWCQVYFHLGTSWMKIQKEEKKKQTRTLSVQQLTSCTFGLLH